MANEWDEWQRIFASDWDQRRAGSWDWEAETFQ